MTIMSKPPSKDYDDNFDRTFGKPEQSVVVCPTCGKPVDLLHADLVWVADNNKYYHMACRYGR